jgi:hypothetical protein
MGDLAIKLGAAEGQWASRMGELTKLIAETNIRIADTNRITTYVLLGVSRRVTYRDGTGAC